VLINIHINITTVTLKTAIIFPMKGAMLLVSIIVASIIPAASIGPQNNVIINTSADDHESAFLDKVLFKFL
jgi:hypothetical protein